MKIKEVEIIRSDGVVNEVFKVKVGETLFSHQLAELLTSKDGELMIQVSKSVAEMRDYLNDREQTLLKRVVVDMCKAHDLCSADGIRSLAVEIKRYITGFILPELNANEAMEVTADIISQVTEEREW